MEFTACSSLCSFQPFSGWLSALCKTLLVQEGGVRKKNKTRFLSSGSSQYLQGEREIVTFNIK